jgi:hypothetical protein
MKLPGFAGDCDFMGVPFLVEQSGKLARDTFPTNRTLAIRKVPWGGRTIVQDLGPEAATVSYTIRLYKDDLAAFRAKVGQIGTLAIVGEPARSGVLLMPLGTVTVNDMHELVRIQVTFMAVT